LEVGGDFYDTLPLSNTSLMLVVADVMGKGLPAALFAASVRTLVRALAKPGGRPSEWLSELNQLMFEELSHADVFVTIQIAVADLARRELRVANAGHCPLLLFDERRQVRSVAPKGMPLGIQLDTTFSEQCVVLDPAASVLLYTDGVTEARNSEGQFFGQARLEHWFGGMARVSQTALELRNNLLQELVLFQGGENAADDQTFLILLDEASRAFEFPARNGSRWSLEWCRPAWAAARLIHRAVNLRH